MSFSVIPPTPWWMTLTRTSACWIFDSSEIAASTEPTTSPLSTRLRSWIAPSWSCLEQRLQRDADAALGELLAPQPLAAHLRVAARLALVLDHAALLARGRRMVEAEDLDRVARPRLLDLLAAEVVERAHLAPGVAGDDRVAHAQGAAVDQHRRGGAAADVEPRLDDRPGSVGLRVRGQLELGVGDEEHLLEQVVEALGLLGRDLGELRRAAPLLGLEAFGGELVADAIGVRVGQVDLVHSDDDRHLGRARVGDRLLRLRHDAVVRGDDQHRDVGHLRAAGAHGREGLVAGRVEEGQLALRRARTWYAPMCCVIPPASVSTTALLRIASSSVVLPWSTWPMIVTTGGRASRSDSSSS